jgi:uncharacterized flavoprotein (TIGR03862 family)
MAAEVLAAGGMSVDLYEHMPSVGRKLLLAGRSGLNLTHAEPLPDVVQRYGTASPIAAAVEVFPPAAVREWAASLGIETFVGSTGRVFPTEMRATPLLRAWLSRLDALGVRIHTRHRWLGWEADGTQRFRRQDGAIAVARADTVVLALGGASWPRVGSDGTWATMLRDRGVTVHALQPSNCGVILPWTRHFATAQAGRPLKNVALSADGGKWVRGDVTVTTDGLESGPVYTLSPRVRAAVQRSGTCAITIDLLPDVPLAAVTDRLQRRRPGDSVTNGLRRSLGLSPIAVAVLRESTGNTPPTDAQLLGALVKSVPLTVTGIAGLSRAISSAGGVALTELTDGFMLRSVPGVYAVGEMLDWEAPTGGYLLQASFSTAVVAAQAALRTR